MSEPKIRRDAPQEGIISRLPSHGMSDVLFPSHWTARLRAPVSAATLGIFRICFGLVMLWETSRAFYLGRIQGRYVDTHFHFPLFDVGLLDVPPAPWVYAPFVLMWVAALCITLGLFYRVATLTFATMYTWVFAWDLAFYNNHYYLIALLAWLLFVVDAHRWGALDARIWPGPSLSGERTVPRWQLWLLRFQVAVVYFYGGVAKLNGSWLRAEPVKLWLSKSADLPLVGPWLAHEGTAYVIAYGGLLLDLLIVPLLLWRRTRLLAVALVTLFHASNNVLFSIGVFPLLMWSTTVLFLEADSPARWLSRWRSGWTTTTPKPVALERLRRWRPLPTRHVMAFLCLYCGAQILTPLRHHLIEGDVAWTREGHDFSWRMMLNSSSGTVRVFVHQPDSGRWHEVSLLSFLTPPQISKMSFQPQMMWRFAQHLAEGMQARGLAAPEVRVLCNLSLNGQPHAQLIDLRANLAAEPYRRFRHNWWIFPSRALSPAPLKTRFF